MNKPFIVWEGSIHEPMLLRNTLVRVIIEYKPIKGGKLEADFSYEWAVGIDAMGKLNWTELPKHDRAKIIPYIISDLVGLPLTRDPKV